MSKREDYPAGVPCWVTNLAPDVRAAMDFYGELFGWTFDYDAEVDFAVARLRGREVAGIGSLAKAGPDVQAAWVTDVRVESADDAAEQGPAAGGRLLVSPMDFPPAGRLTVLADPAGAVVCAWEAGTRKGAQVVNEAGAWSMSALQTPDPEGAAAFYHALFGWGRDAFGDMTMFRRPGYVGGEPEQPVPRDVVAAMGPPARGPAAWVVDFWTDDAEAAAATADRNGGRVVADLEDMGPFRRANLADPAGATFTVSQLVLDRVR